MNTDNEILDNQPDPGNEPPAVPVPVPVQPVPASQAAADPQAAAPGAAAPSAAPAGQPQNAYREPVFKKPPVKFDKTDSVFSFIALVTGFLFCEFILFGGLGIGVPLFFICAYAGILLYGRKSKSIDIKKGAPLFIPIVLLLISFVLFSNMTLSILSLVFLFFLATLQFMSMFGMRDHTALSKGLVFDFFNGFVGRPLLNLDKLFVITAKGAKEQKGNRLFLRILLGIVICIPLMAVILMLLSSADKAFEGVLNKLTAFIGDSFWEYLGKIILGFGIAIPLFGAFYAFRYKNKNGTLKMPVMPHILDRVIAYTILSIVNAVYILFLAVQFNYMFFAFSGKLPGGFIYADYARRGFFELVAIAVINLGVLSVFYIFTGRREGKLPKALKTLLLMLSFITMVIIGSALAKMVMYMKVFGLTQLRIYTSWFMLLTAVVFLLAVAKILSRKFNAVRIFCVFFTAWFVVLNFACTDTLIVKYNISKSEQNKSTALDVKMFDSLSDSMVPYAVGLLNESVTPNATTLEGLMRPYTLKADLTQRYNRLKNTNWQAFNLSSYKAKKALKKNKEKFSFNFKGNTLQAASGQNKEMLQNILPKLTRISSCQWYLNLTNGENANWYGDYEFYGFTKLTDKYYKEITQTFEWIASASDFSEIDYFKNIPGDKDIFTSSDYDLNMNDKNTIQFMLDKADKTLYFYATNNYLYPNNEYVSRMD